MKRPPNSLKAHALALLARREQSRSELRSKLEAHARKLSLHAADATEAPEADERTDRHGLSAAQRDEVEAVLDWLVANRYQSDERFAESRIHARAGRHGQARIRMELSQHGLSLAPEAAQTLRETELSRAREVWRKRFSEPPTTPEERARQMRFLAARGFGGDVIRRVVGGRED